MANNAIDTIANGRKGVVIHNDAGYGNAKSYEWMKNDYNRLSQGFAHTYVDEHNRVYIRPDNQVAWHTATVEGNEYYMGVEVCQSMGDEAQFLRNEQATFRYVAEYMRVHGMTPNRETVRLHREFSPTACPHRSWDLHGKDVNAVKDYFISQIQKHMNELNGGAPAPTPAPIPTPAPTPTPQPQQGGLVNQTGTCEVLVDTLNVRSAPSKGAEVVAQYKRGDTFTYDGYVDAEGIRWVSYIGATSGLRRYVARRELDNTFFYTNAY